MAVKRFQDFFQTFFLHIFKYLLENLYLMFDWL